MAIDMDSLTEGVVSAEQLASGEVQISADQTSARIIPQDEQPIDSGAVEAAFREAAEKSQEEVEEPAEEEEVAAQEEEEEEEQPKPKKKNDAQSRIRQLAAEKKEYQQRFEQQQAQYQQQMAQMQQQLAAQQGQFQQKLLDLEAKRLAMAQEDKSRAELAQMSEPERRAYEFRKQIEAEAAKLAKAEVSGELAELKKQVAEFNEWKNGAAEHAKASQRQKQMENMVGTALDKHVFKGVQSEKVKTLRPVTEEIMAMYAAAYGQAPEEIAPQFVQYMDAWAAMRNEEIAKSAGNTLKKGKALPKPAAPKAGVAAQKEPSLEEIKKLGYPNFVRYRAAKMMGKVR